MAKCFHILKPTMDKWAQYPAQMELWIEPYPMRILRALGDALGSCSTKIWK